MESTGLAVRIIPDRTIDDKYAEIIGDALQRILSFTDSALKDGRVGELFSLDRLGMDPDRAAKILRAKGRLMVGFQFENRSDPSESTFQMFVRKFIDRGRDVKFRLAATVQEIMLQLISLEDRRSVAVFSMLNSSLDVGHRVLAGMYGSQLKRIAERADPVISETITAKLEKLKVTKISEESDLWKEGLPSGTAAPAKERRPGTQDNILRVMADDSIAEDIYQHVENIISRAERIREKRRLLEENPDMSSSEIYELMVREDLDQLENCYARMHIYLRAFYKNRDKRNPTQNKILRQFFGGQIEQITGETGLLEDLLSLNEQEYLKNIYRHRDL